MVIKYNRKEKRHVFNQKRRSGVWSIHVLQDHGHLIPQLPYCYMKTPIKTLV